VVHSGSDGWQGVQDVPLSGPNADGVYEAVLFPGQAQSLEFAIRWSDGTWENNGGQDFRVRR
jgi:hypothetical protein